MVLTVDEEALSDTDIPLAASSSGLFGVNDSHLSQPSVRNGNDTSPTLQPPRRTKTGSITMTYDGKGFSREDKYTYKA